VNQRYRRLAFLRFLLAFLTASATAFSQLVPGSLDVHWNKGAKDCAANLQPPLQVHAYDESQTLILRQSPCADFEANFLYLLIGSSKALLIRYGSGRGPKPHTAGRHRLALATA
jgi:hydroxyacylglutathione hydrolase